MGQLAARLMILLGLRSVAPPVHSWRDPAPKLCVGQTVHTGRALSAGGAP